MKKHLLLAAWLITLAVPSFAQFTPVSAADSTLDFACPRVDCEFAIAILPPDDAGRDAIIAACIRDSSYASDTSHRVVVSLRQRDVAVIARIISLQGEGVATAFAQRLVAILMPMLPTRPWLAEQFGLVVANNDRLFTNRAAEGAAIIKSRAESTGRQQPH